MRAYRGLLGVVLVIAAVVAMGVAFQAQAQTNLMVKPQLSLVIPGMLEHHVVVPSQVLARLKTTKAKADIQLLKNTYFMRNNKPFIRLLNKQEFQLIPLDLPEPKPSAAQLTAAAKLPAFMSKYSKLVATGVDPSLLMGVFVDHRAKQTSIKNQDWRGTCVCFASMAGLEAAYGGGSLDLSEQYANYLYMKAEGKGCKSDGLQTHKSAEYLTANGVGTDTRCPYQISFPSWCTNGGATTPQRTDIAAHAPYQIESYQKIWRNDELTSDTGPYINNPVYLESLLAEGKDIIYGTHVAGWTGNVTGLVDVKLDAGGNPLPSEGGHALLIVGYNRPEQYFIVKNSWGAGVGQSGYLYLSYDYIRTYAKYGYYITKVKPVFRAAPLRELRIIR